MLAFRTLLAQRPVPLLLLCVAALLLRLLVPTGYMVSSDQGQLSVVICSGVEARTVTMNMPGMQGDMPDHGNSTDHGTVELPCAFSGLSTPALSATDAVQLAALIAFVIATGAAGVVLPPPATRPYLRPPLRGPPANP